MFTDPPWLQPRTAYLHVPFCGHHCGYCDFAVTAGQDHLIELYLDALELELAALGQPQPVETIFVGGGTPTYLTAKQLRRLLEAIHKWLPIISPGSHEFSVESTPESLDAEKVHLLAAFGVNRVSIGVQSFHPHLLAALERRHGVEQIPQAVEMVRKQIPAISFDLIFAAPGQTLAQWEADLDAALAFDPDHVSTYGLTYEKGTPLWKDRERGAVRTVDEDNELAMYEHAMDRLAAAGFEHYEISNFAKPGKRCRHNDRYWANEAYFGVGVGAARYVQWVRELNVRDTKLYVRRVLAGETPTYQSEELDPRERAFETIATQLRRADGVRRDRFRDQTGFELDELIGDWVRDFTANGLLLDDDSSVRLTRRGKCLADGIVTSVMKSR
ncbi:radical SAM family heme chaperone HemW [Limnoglobus roseus]|uniref:Heme chaperone HemW n=1 Tax=Limnoglobus roseus TaxID=2598579 RepID=A0A5C1AM62_9BACT|nr:radical SAM family heme chaperone HemW [Limnoglobus roseus]QEL20311.1 coproporphyrinogen III oxidase family protein [Limnoglobus roseus]